MLTRSVFPEPETPASSAAAAAILQGVAEFQQGGLVRFARIVELWIGVVLERPPLKLPVGLVHFQAPIAA